MSQNDYTYLTPGATDTQQKLLYLIAKGIDSISGGSSGYSVSPIGSPSDPPWNGTDPEATVISLLKTIAQNTV